MVIRIYDATGQPAATVAGPRLRPHRVASWLYVADPVRVGSGTCACVVWLDVGAYTGRCERCDAVVALPPALPPVLDAATADKTNHPPPPQPARTGMLHGTAGEP